MTAGVVISALAVAFVVWSAAVRRQKRLIEKDREEMREAIRRGANK